MESPLEKSRKGIDADFEAMANDFTVNRLVYPPDRLPTQFDRQIDQILSPVSAGGGGGAAVYPFDVISAGTSSFTVQPGTMSGLLPSNYGSTFTPTPSTTYYLELNCTASSGQIATVALNFASSAPSAIPVNMGQPPTSFSFLLGILVTDGTGGGTWFRCIAPGSLFAIGALQYQTNKASPAPGTLPFDNWYTWLIEQV
jgi:hypothetical protein